MSTTDDITAIIMLPNVIMLPLEDISGLFVKILVYISIICIKGGEIDET